QLQQLLQENTDKESQIHHLQEQIANFEATQSETAQVEEENQQLKREFYALQQRYNQLSFEMARNEQ
ncbi:hypothetical protein, partial [Phormidium sp. CCY1219]|uniref:hypothetical protein n=1 Tax=Phormidium sp. CCY1219 TaxID=2886104 RepID=UPI002D1ED371